MAGIAYGVSTLYAQVNVIQLKRPWSKGHFRKARALMKLNRYTEAKEGIQLGLSYEPNNQVRILTQVSTSHIGEGSCWDVQEMNQMLTDIDSHLNASTTNLEKVSSPIPVS